MIPKIEVRSAFAYDVDKASDESGLECKDESLAQQNQKDEADINTIVRRFGLTGKMPENYRAPSYGDFTGITDYHSALNAVKQAEEAFMLLPAEIRAEFDNNPQDLILAVENPEERPRLEELGIFKKKPLEAVQAMPVPPVTPVTPVPSVPPVTPA